MKRKYFTAIAALSLAVLVLGAALLAEPKPATASPATSSDPLITKSYLDGPFRTTVTGDINSALAPLSTRLTAAENRITTELNTARTASASVFKLENIANGGRRTVGAGSEILMESGSVTFTGTLIRSSGTPDSVSNGSLAVNNLYIATTSVTLTATSASKVWLRAESITLSSMSIDDDDLAGDAPEPDDPAADGGTDGSATTTDSSEATANGTADGNAGSTGGG